MVVTVPLGVLRKESIAFDPPLDGDHAQAVERLEMATLEKVALRFPERFWPESVWQITHVAGDLRLPGVVRLQPSRRIAHPRRLLQPRDRTRPRRAPG